LHPAVSEGFSNAVLEAQAMGLPVVCTDADGLSENIENNLTGFVVPKWDAEAIAEKLVWCYSHQDEAMKMGEKGVERVNKLFKIEQQIDKFVKYYSDLKKHES
jgi:colanic acid/amylovoran biosynthesis glycosyltransferase